MKLTLLLALSLAVAGVALAAAPEASACPTDGCFGECHVVWYAYGEYRDPQTGEWKPLEAPGGVQCVW